MKRYLQRVALLTLLISSPGLAAAQSAAPDTVQTLAGTIAKLFNAGALLLITATIVVFFYGIVGNIYNLNKGEGSGDMRKNMLWGIGILFLMVSIWGVIQVLQYSLFGGPSPSATNGVIIYNH